MIDHLLTLLAQPATSAADSIQALKPHRRALTVVFLLSTDPFLCGLSDFRRSFVRTISLVLVILYARHKIAWPTKDAKHGTV